MNNSRFAKITGCFIFLVMGLTIITYMSGSHNKNMGYLNFYAVAWVVAFVLLCVTSQSVAGGALFYLQQMLYFGATGIFLWAVFSNPYILILIAFIQWVTILTSLNKLVFYMLFGLHIVQFSIFTFVLHEFSVAYFLASVAGISITCWMSCLFSKKAKEEAFLESQYEQSLDDMLALVDAKFSEAKRANKAKSSFLANMSHEIRTPINVVLGLNTMVLRESTDAKIKSYANDIEAAGQTLLSLINDILDLSKVESGKLEIIPARYELSELVSDAVNMIGIKARDKKLTVNLKVDKNLPSGLVGDDVRIRQVLINLLNNAVKYTEEGGITLQVSGVRSDNLIMLKFAVTDTGIGIKKEDMGRLFTQFERIEEFRNRNIEGTGLGMSISLRILSLMNSKLEVESTYGEGSTFYFYLMQEIYNDEPVGLISGINRIEKSDVSYKPSFVAPDAKILLVDDNMANRVVFSNLLKQVKVQIDEADGGYSCLRAAARTKYDVIFLDHMMPDLDGLETYKKIRSDVEGKNHDTPVIALTANAIQGAREMYIEAGFNDYLTKPIIPEKLEKILWEMLPNEKKSEEADNNEIDKKEVEAASLSDGDKKDFPVIRGINWDYAFLHIPEKDVLLHVIQVFYETIEEDAVEIEKLYEAAILNNDSKALKNFEIKVHGLKSSAALFGAFSLSGMAAALEFAVKDNEIDLIRDVTPHFVNNLREMKSKLSVFCQ